MGPALTTELAFKASWETLERGEREDRACFCAFGIQYGDIWLTEAEDGFSKSLRAQPYLSSYRIAEWLAWNWWRLRWEPRTQAPDWAFAHSMATIGHGYIWPNITIFSDGQRIALIAKPTAKRPEEPLRYIADHVAIISAKNFESTLDGFLYQVRDRLYAEGIVASNFDNIWHEVLAERADPDMALRRKFEALLGADPDEGNSAAIDTLVADARSLGRDAMGEIAAAHRPGGAVLTAADLRHIARRNGSATSLDDMVRFPTDAAVPKPTEVPAWKRGAQAAKLLRRQEKLGEGAISNQVLADLAGVDAGVLAVNTQHGEISFVLSETGDTRTILRSKWEAGRRFELARLMGDRILHPKNESFFPATRVRTYRQKVQRSFAVELLAPFEEVNARWDGEDSQDSFQEVAEQFNVSALTIATLLRNHGKLEREDFDDDFIDHALPAA